jgi:hypothetical protein
MQLPGRGSILATSIKQMTRGIGGSGSVSRERLLLPVGTHKDGEGYEMRFGAANNPFVNDNGVGLDQLFVVEDQ